MLRRGCVSPGGLSGGSGAAAGGDGAGGRGEPRRQGERRQPARGGGRQLVPAAGSERKLLAEHCTAPRTMHKNTRTRLCYRGRTLFISRAGLSTTRARTETHMTRHGSAAVRGRFTALSAAHNRQTRHVTLLSFYFFFALALGVLLFSPSLIGGLKRPKPWSWSWTTKLLTGSW